MIEWIFHFRTPQPSAHQLNIIHNNKDNSNTISNSSNLSSTMASSSSQYRYEDLLSY